MRFVGVLCKEKIPSDHSEFKKNHTHIICYSIILYNIVKRHDPYSAIVIKSLLHFYANIIHSYALIMTPHANDCVVLWRTNYAADVTVFLYV